MLIQIFLYLLTSISLKSINSIKISIQLNVLKKYAIFMNNFWFKPIKAGFLKLFLLAEPFREAKFLTELQNNNNKFKNTWNSTTCFELFRFWKIITLDATLHSYPSLVCRNSSLIECIRKLWIETWTDRIFFLILVQFSRGPNKGCSKPQGSAKPALKYKTLFIIVYIHHTFMIIFFWNLNEKLISKYISGNWYTIL